MKTQNELYCGESWLRGFTVIIRRSNFIAIWTRLFISSRNAYVITILVPDYLWTVLRVAQLT